MLGLRDSRFHVRNAFGGKYLTAIVEDEASNAYVIPIKRKHIIHGHFFVRLAGQMYIFKIMHDRISVVRNWGTHPVSIIHYSTKHFLPVSMDQVADLEEFRKRNPSIKQIDELQAVLLGAAKALEEETKLAVAKGGPQADGPVAITMQDALDYVMRGADLTQPQAVQRLAEYTSAMDRLGTRVVVTPLALVTDFLSETVQASSLSLISILRQLEAKHWQWKAIANPAKTPFQHWGAVIAVAVAAAALIGGTFVLTGADVSLTGDAITFDDLVAAQEAGLPPPGAPPAAEPAEQPEPVVPPPEPTSSGPLSMLPSELADPTSAFDAARGLAGGVIPGVGGRQNQDDQAALPDPPEPATMDSVAARLHERETARVSAMIQDAALNRTVDDRRYGQMPAAEWERANKQWCGLRAEACVQELERLQALDNARQAPEDRIHGNEGQHGENCMERYYLTDPSDGGHMDKWAPCGLNLEQATAWQPRDWESLFSHPEFRRT